MKIKKINNKPINFDDFASNYKNHISNSFGYIDNDVSYYHSAKAKIAKNELDYTPKVHLEDGLRRFIEWCRSDEQYINPEKL
jgi:nucleoside-diphosphate-sugar epimerase